ncbi:MAG: hypothetical protein ACTSUO_00850 [Candidatus Thorarchaeota archaeon]
MEDRLKNIDWEEVCRRWSKLCDNVQVTVFFHAIDGDHRGLISTFQYIIPVEEMEELGKKLLKVFEEENALEV